MKIAKFYLLVFVLINVSRSEDSSGKKIVTRCKCESEPSYKACVKKGVCERKCKERFCIADCYRCDEWQSGIIRRREWGARNAKDTEKMVRPVPYVIIHHSAGESCFNLTECSASARSIQNFHMDERNWWDIGYNFLIGGDGNVYEGRGWKIIGAQAGGWNNMSIGICFMGLYTDDLPTKSALLAARKLIACGVESGEIRTDYELVGHRQVMPVNYTECPGRALYRVIRTWPHSIEKP